MVQSTDLMTPESEYRCDAAWLQIARFHLAEPLDDLLRIGEGYRLDMCLTDRPKNARARYVARWGPNRYEPVGTLFLVRDAEAVHARSDPGQGVLVVCQLRSDAVLGWFEGDLQWTDHRLEAGFDIGSPTIKGLLHRVASELRNPGFAHGVLLESIVMQIAVELQRYCTSVGSGDREGLAPWRLRLIEERLHECLSPPTLRELSELCQISTRQLTRGFRVSRGCSIAEHVANKRVEHAKRLIAEGEGIKVVANALGFASPSSFTYSFRKATGLTPCEFRETLAGLTFG